MIGDIIGVANVSQFSSVIKEVQIKEIKVIQFTNITSLLKLYLIVIFTFIIMSSIGI